MVMFMVLYHIGLPTDTIVAKVLMCFIPFFFVKSGMFHKVQHMSTIIKKFIVPYFIYGMMGYIVLIWHGMVTSTLSFETMVKEPLLQIFWQGSAWCNAPLWFLLALGACKILANLVTEKYMWCYGVFGFLLASVLYLTSVKVPLYFSYIGLGMMFYAIGYYIREKQFLKWIGVISLIVYCLIQCLYPCFLDVHTNNVLYGNYYLAIISATIGVIAINNIMRWIGGKINFSVLSTIGRFSMTIFAFHWVILESVKVVMRDMIGTMESMAIYRFFACCIFIPLVCYLQTFPLNKNINNTNYA